MCVFIFVKRFLYTFRPSGAFSGSMSLIFLQKPNLQETYAFPQEFYTPRLK